MFDLAIKVDVSRETINDALVHTVSFLIDNIEHNALFQLKKPSAIITYFKY